MLWEDNTTAKSEILAYKYRGCEHADTLREMFMIFGLSCFVEQKSDAHERNLRLLIPFTKQKPSGCTDFGVAYMHVVHCTLCAPHESTYP